MTALTKEDMASILRGYTKDLAEANAYILASILSETKNAAAIVTKLEGLLESPDLDGNPVAHEYLHLVVTALNCE